jgi:two-component system, NarL family, nitrate/nitrite response regulator NarL
VVVRAIQTFSLAVVQPRDLLLEGLRGIFRNSRFRIACRCSSLAELWEAVPADEKLTAILVDCDEHAPISESDVERLHRTYPHAKIILLADPSVCERVMRNGADADGLILKSSPAAVLVKALELIMLGERIFPAAARRAPGVRETGVPVVDEAQPDPSRAAGRQPSLTDTMRNHVSRVIDHLSAREIEVIQLLCSGSPNKIIARQLNISEATVKVHVKAILRKTQAKNRTEAALMMSPMFRPSLDSH